MTITTTREPATSESRAVALARFLDAREADHGALTAEKRELGPSPAGAPA
jgi:hypothetical protein